MCLKHHHIVAQALSSCCGQLCALGTATLPPTLCLRHRHTMAHPHGASHTSTLWPTLCPRYRQTHGLLGASSTTTRLKHHHVAHSMPEALPQRGPYCALGTVAPCMVPQAPPKYVGASCVPQGKGYQHSCAPTKNRHWNTKILCVCIQWSHRICSSRFIPNLCTGRSMQPRCTTGQMDALHGLQ